MHGISNFKKKESNFIENFTHDISHELIKLCLSNKIGILELSEIKQITEDSKDFPLVIRNWSFGKLLNKIEYKSKLNGIKLIVS
jgi:IS605 OrfB family transposase